MPSSRFDRVLHNDLKPGNDTYLFEYLDGLKAGAKILADFMSKCFGGTKPIVAITLGSGLSQLASEVETLGVLNFLEVSLPVASALGHEGKFIAAKLDGHPVILQKGRLHTYEGYSSAVVALPIRMMMNAGLKRFVITNAAGGLSTDYQIGDLVVITGSDVSQMQSPAEGLYGELIGQAFFSVGQIYSEQLQNEFIRLAGLHGLSDNTHKGVYVFRKGPNYEEPFDILQLQEARARWLKINPDLAPAVVGMSSANEIHAAAQYNSQFLENDLDQEKVSVLTVSNITNYAQGISGANPTAHEVISQANIGGQRIIKILRAMLPYFEDLQRT
jgi:purine-nucleoside phosphorylase